jgi:methionyl aminopeptidase
MAIAINSESDIAKMRTAGRLGSEVLDYITPFFVHGVTTEKLDQLCHDYIINVQQAIPAPKKVVLVCFSSFFP